jgi:UDP-N-acetylglucosamine 2-epimerase (non-hydrolysing)
MTILVCYGTRPEKIKLDPVIAHLAENSYRVFFTGQHNEKIGVTDFPNLSTTLKSVATMNRLDQVLISCLTAFPSGDPPSVVLVQGDTASAYGCALAAFNRGVPVAHLEAGLRSGSRTDPFPEETYRRCISELSSIHLCPTELSAQNLQNQGVLGDIHVVGNTVLDPLLALSPSYGNIVPITLHRRENQKNIAAWLGAIEDTAHSYTDLEFRFFVHPAIERAFDPVNYPSVCFSNPLPHHEFVALMAQARFVITDSGGLQEEGAFLNKKVIVCRKVTERPEGIETGHLKLCATPENLIYAVDNFRINWEIKVKCPYGDGHSGQRVAKILQNYLQR